MKIGWGWKIGLLYGGFVVMMVGLVVASSRQNVDLVSNDYYVDEIKYQGVLDASKNEAGLAGAITVHADSGKVVIEFPAEFDKSIIKGNVVFYAANNKDWDRDMGISVNDNKMIVPRSGLQRALYQLKVTYSVDGKEYYYQTQIDLHTS